MEIRSIYNTTISIQNFGGSEVEILVANCVYNGAINDFGCLIHFPIQIENSAVALALGGGCAA